MESASVALRRPATEERSISINVGGGVGRGFGDGADGGASSVASAGLRTASMVAAAWLMRVSHRSHATKRVPVEGACNSLAGSDLRQSGGFAAEEIACRRVLGARFAAPPSTRHDTRSQQRAKIRASTLIRRKHPWRYVDCLIYGRFE
jgi:hypothetical protein